MYILFGQSIENNYVVDTIQEFRSESSFQGLLYHAFRIVAVGTPVLPPKTDSPTEIFQLPASDIGGHNYDRIFKVDSSPQTVRQLPVIE